MQASRLLAILMLLQTRARVTAKELAAEFEVSRRTIYRDIDQLSAARVPLYAERGPGGGYRLPEGYETRLTGLAPDEARALFMIGLPGPAASLGLGQASARARCKLLAALPPTARADAARLEARFHFDIADWYRAPEPTAHLAAVARAVLDQRALHLCYRSWSRTRRWRIEPLGLVLKGGAWYLVARGDPAVRIFKVSQILQLKLSPGPPFQRPADFDLPAQWAAALERFEGRLRRGRALLRVSPAGGARLSRLGVFAERALAAATTPDCHGWVRVTLPVEDQEQAALLLLGLGPEVEVLQPARLRRRLGQLALAVARRQRQAAQRSTA